MSDAIEAASVGVRTMADGTLRLSVDIEPRHAQAAFALFGSPGTALAIVALKPAGIDHIKTDQPKGGPLAQLAGRWCDDSEFQEWMKRNFAYAWNALRADDPQATPSNIAAALMREKCRIDSRAELDSNIDAKYIFNHVFRAPYMAQANALK